MDKKRRSRTSRKPVTFYAMVPFQPCFPSPCPTDSGVMNIPNAISASDVCPAWGGGGATVRCR
jgi:hypothetical protein